ncbi:MAG: putative amidohydrolase YtcJ [Flavobacterium sp.]|jgi:predicted amidohydrolase YtcJ
MRNFYLRLIKLVSFIVIIPITSCIQYSVIPADAVYSGGRIYTANTVSPWAQSIAVKGNRIVYVADERGAAKLICEHTKTLPLNGRLVLPGLIDGHTHPGYIALASRHLPLPEAGSTEVLYKAVETMVNSHPDQDVIIAIPWDNNLFGPNGPHKRMLDEIEPNRPLLIWDSWMHSLWVNTKALEAAGVDSTVEDPVPGFAFHQRDEQGDLTGYITESAATDFWNKFESLAPQSETTLLAFLTYLKNHGVTTLLDAGNFGLDHEVYKSIQRLDKLGKLPLRYHGTYTLFLPDKVDTAVATLKAMRSEFKSQKITVDTLKLFLDGVIETRTAHMFNDYIDTPGNNGNALLSRDRLHALILELEREGLHLHFHTVGNKATTTALNAIEDARKTLDRPFNIRIALSHLEDMDVSDASRFKTLGVIAQFTPQWHGGSDSDSYDYSIGELQEKMFLTKSLFNAGAVVSFSSDTYFTSDWEAGNANPFTGIQVGHNRQKVEDGPNGPVAEPKNEALSREEMVTGYTRNGAYQLGVEDQVGSLEVGKKADFIVLDKDLFTVDKYTIHQVKPDAVILDGEIVHGAL